MAEGPGSVDIPNDEHDKETDVHTDTEIEFKNCDQCLLNSEKTKGTRYCVSCVKYLCDNCAKIHKTTKETHSHNVLIFEDIPYRAQQVLRILASTTSCPVHHYDEFDYVCVQHGQCICSKCDKYAHMDCGVLKKVAYMVDSLNDRKDLVDSLHLLNRVRQFFVDEGKLKTDDLYYMRLEQYYVTAGRNCMARVFYELLTDHVPTEAKEKEKIFATMAENVAKEKLFDTMAKKILESEGIKMVIEKLVRGQMNIEELIQTTLDHGTEKQIYIIRSHTKCMVKGHLIAARHHGFVEHDPIQHNEIEKFEDVLMVRGAAGEERILKRHLEEKDSARVTQLKEERISKSDGSEGLVNYTMDHAFAGIRDEQIRELRKALERANTSNKQEGHGKISTVTVTEAKPGDDTKEDSSVGNATMNGSEKYTLTIDGLSNATEVSDQLLSMSITNNTHPKQDRPKKKKTCGKVADIKGTIPSPGCPVSARPTPTSPLKSEAQQSRQQRSFSTSVTNKKAHRQGTPHLSLGSRTEANEDASKSKPRTKRISPSSSTRFNLPTMAPHAEFWSDMSRLQTLGNLEHITQTGALMPRPPCPYTSPTSSTLPSPTSSTLPSPQPPPDMALRPITNLMIRRLIFVGLSYIFRNYKPCSILGMITLADGRFVFMDDNKTISVFDVNLKLSFYHQLRFKPCGICHLSGDIIALAWACEKRITFFQIESDHLHTMYSMHSHKQCRAIAKYPEGIAVLLVEGDNFEIEIRKPGEIQATRKIPRFEHDHMPVKMNPVSFLFSEIHGFLIGDARNGVFCFDESGLQKWCYDGDVYARDNLRARIIDVTSIAEDKMGNIYACGRATANIHQISNIDSMQTRILIPKLDRAQSVVIDRFNRLVIGCYDDDSVKVYGFEQ